MPYHLAMQLALTGEPLPAERLAEVGLVNEIADDGQAMTVAIELAGRITSNAPLAIRASKAILSGALDRPMDRAWSWQDSISEPVSSSEDAVEGSRAFLEKRRPVWRGR